MPRNHSDRSILEVVCKKISTAQDCIVTTVEYKWEVDYYLREGMNSFIGHYPHTKVEDWNPDYEANMEFIRRAEPVF